MDTGLFCEFGKLRNNKEVNGGGGSCITGDAAAFNEPARIKILGCFFFDLAGNGNDWFCGHFAFTPPSPPCDISLESRVTGF